MNKNNIIITVVSVVVIFAFLLGVYALTSNTNEKVYADVNKVLPTDHLKWASDKKNLLVEFSDLQCPACKSFHDYMKANVDNDPSITKKITFVYRHFPLDQHVHSHQAAYAAEAAGKQGKFFEFADTLFSTQTQWEGMSNDDVVNYFVKVATDLKMDPEKFKTDMNSKEAKQVVDDNQLLGSQSDVNATPTFFLNGKKLDFATLDEFKNALKDVK